MTASENQIRDALAERLDVLEPDLSLVEKEYKLPNPIGGKGYVDILARDRFGLHVVVELKRTDTAARQAIHEIYKYTALIRTTHGLAADMVRCIVVATTWHELLVPFSDFSRSVSFHVDGYKLEVDADGIPLSIEPIEALEGDEGLELCPSGLTFLFTSREAREGQRGDIERAAAEVGIEDYLLIEQDYAGDDDRVIYPFADCFMMATISNATRAALEERLDLEVDPDEEESGGPFYFEDLVMGEMGGHLEPSKERTAEIAYPDKFRTHEDNWPPLTVRRYGKRLTSDLRSDEDLLAMVRSDVGGYSSHFEQVASPRIAPAWTRVRQDLRRCLLGNGGWDDGINAFLDELEAEPPTAIGIDLFNPTDLMIGLYKLRAEATPAYLPTAQVILEPDTAGRMRVLVGLPEWDGSTIRDDPQEVLDEFFEGDLMNYFTMRTVAEVWTLEDALLRWHGLSCDLYEVTIAPEIYKRAALEVADGVLVRRDLDEAERPGLPLLAFVEANGTYLDRLVEMIKSQSLGL